MNMTSSLEQNFREKKVFGGLDGLRFFSIFAVIWHHSAGTVDWFPATQYAFLGVDLFFVISGFLIVTLLLRERDRVGHISLKAFYIRRALRIFPVYYGFILGLALLYLIFNSNSEFGSQFISDLPIYLLYLANFFPIGLGIMWSLASEEQFYLLWPFLEKYLKKIIIPLLILALAINQFINFNREIFVEWTGIPYLAEASILQATFTPILLGVGLAHMFHSGMAFKYFGRLITSSLSAPLWLAVLVIYCSFLPDDISGLPRLLIHLNMVMLVASVVVNEDNLLMPVLKFPPFVRIGVISYGIYLFHMHAIMVAEKMMSLVNIHNPFLLFILGFIIVYLIAEVSYRFYEKPFLKLKSKFSVIHQKHD